MTTPQTPPTRRRHPWRWLLATLLGLLLLFLALTAWLVTTHSGLRTLARWAEQALPGTLEIGAVEGRLSEQFTLHDLRLHLPTLELGAAELELAWQPAQLFAGTLHLTRLLGRDLDILTIANDTPKEPLRLPQIALPLQLEVEQLRVERLRLAAQATPDKPLLVLTQAELAAELTGSELRVQRLEAKLARPEVDAQAAGHLALRDAYPLDVQLDWTLTQAPALRLEGQGRARGDLRQLQLTHRIQGSATVTLEAELAELLQQPRWNAQLEVTQVDLPSLVAEAPAVDLSARLETRGDLDQAQVTGTLQAAAPDYSDFGQLAAELDLDWRDQRLRIAALKLTEPQSGARLDVQGQLDLAHAQGQVELNGVWEALRWPLTGAARFASPQGTLAVSGQLDRFNYTLDAELFGQALPEMRLGLSGEGHQHGTRIAELRLDSLGGQLLGKGTLNWAPQLAWDLALTARELDPGRQWAGFKGVVGLKAESQGNVHDGYDYQLKADVALSDYPPLVTNLSGTGTLSALNIASVDVETLGGRITGSGQLDWAGDLTWQAGLRVADVDPGHYQAAWAGRLGGEITTQGQLPASGPDLQVRIRDFGGQWRGYPVQADARLSLQGSTFDIHALQLRSGATELNASGQVGETLAMDVTLSSPDLGELLPAAGGRLEIDGQGRGTRQSPRLTLKLSARDVQLHGQGIATLDGQADLGLGPEAPLQIRLSGQDLLAGGVDFDRLEVHSQGTLAAHRLTATLHGEALSANLALSGRQPEPGDYQAELSRLTLETADFSDWKLEQAMPIVLGPGGRMELGPLCLSNGQASGGCAHLRQSQTGVFDASLALKRLALALFDPLLPPTLDLHGFATAEARISARNAQLTGRAELRLPSGELELAVPEANNRLVFSGAKLALNADAQGANASLELPLVEVGALTAQARLPGFALQAPHPADQKLDGQLRLDARDLSRLGQLVPDLSELRGALMAEARLSGTLKAPEVRGQAQLGPVSFQVPLLGLRVAEARLQAHLDGGDQVTLTGGADIGGGQLRLSGAGQRAASGWTLGVKLAGEQLKVADSKEYFALIGTALQGDLGPAGLQVRGEVKVEEARIMPRAIPAGTLATAADVVVEGQQDRGAQGGLPLDADVEINLSDAVLIEAFGLRAKLRGRLRAIAEPDQPLLGDGQLEVVDGTYRLSSQFGLMASVGAPLKISQGILMFAKTPLSNPGLVLSAQREGGDMTAGVRVLGTLKKPKLAFFSESDPNLTDAEIVNYLLTGVPPSGDTSGLDRSLSVGTYVTPKLFLEYESNLGDQADKVKLRYDLNRWIELQTETGAAQGADLFFKFEN